MEIFVVVLVVFGGVMLWVNGYGCQEYWVEYKLRHGKMPRWLEKLGFTLPDKWKKESHVNTDSSKPKS